MKPACALREGLPELTGKLFSTTAAVTARLGARQAANLNEENLT